MSGYVLLDGAGDWVSTADKAALDITDNIEVVALVQPDTWTPVNDQYLFTKWQGPSNLSWALLLKPNAALQMRISGDGTTDASPSGTVLLDTVVSDGDHLWLRATVVFTGFSFTTQLFYSADPLNTAVGSVSWTQLGTDLTAGSPTSLFAGTAEVRLGAAQLGTPREMAGRHYGGRIYDGIGGTLVASPDPRTDTQGWSSPPAPDGLGNDWALVGDATWVPPATPSLLATGTQTIVDVVNESDNTTDLHLSVDDDPASPDDGDWVNNAVDVT